MATLDLDLQTPKRSIQEFADVAVRVLDYFPNVLSSFEEKNGYRIYQSEMAGSKKFVRPIKTDLFLSSSRDFKEEFDRFTDILGKIKNGEAVDNEEKLLIDKTVYTLQQSIGAGLDLLVNPNSARKHVGNRFEELIRLVFDGIGISNKKVVLQIPYETEDGIKTYKCENDIILSPYKSVRSTSSSLDKKEVVVSVKTTSKDRMGKMFIDKMLLERFVEHPQKVIGIFLNDVQRKENNNISYTLVSGLFMVYTKFLTQLEGIYYVDPPPATTLKPYNAFMKPFSELLTNEIKKLLSS